MKKIQKKLPLLLLLVAIVFVSAGCVQYSADGTPTGWVYQYLGQPASNFLNFLANIFGGSYGMAIIIVTIITRLLMLPSSLKMTRTSMISQARMKIAQPEIDEIREEIDAAQDPTEKAKLNQELMAVYKKYDIDMFGGLTGCLPILIQMPIISAVYAAIRSSDAINQSTFLGIHLGEKNMLIVILVVLLTFLQGWLMQRATPKSDNPTANQTTSTMLLMNPIMLGWISYVSAAGIGLYFLVGSVFALVQQIYSNHVLKPKIQKMLDEESAKLAATPRQKRKAAAKANNTTPTGTKRLVPTKQPISTQPNDTNRRNAGKQQRRK
ncbi:membrane protein insertase YidC [Aerococcaceae bacterium zg-ZJ1578]|uniref:membrane protein insertase YidC n=1 Tax=Aerococcaceae bacterium zg-252 TaxID=2796928 RepID=UPI001A180888|nr:membrane protein insertase YidC [Aerococcaceae bacterium zg-1578]